jgi:hypothetical protein
MSALTSGTLFAVSILVLGAMMWMFFTTKDRDL